jgi:HEAT repeat protein
MNDRIRGRFRFRIATLLLLVMVAAVGFGWLRYANKQAEKLEQVQERADRQEVLLDVYRSDAVTGGYGAAAAPPSPITVEEFIRELKHATDINAPYVLTRPLPESQHRAAIPLLADLYNDGNETQRRHAVIAIGNIGIFDESSVATLVRAAEDSSSEVRCFALDSLGKTKSPTIKSTVTKALVDGNAYVRIGAAKALCIIGEEYDAVSALIPLLQDNDPKVVEGAIDAFTFNRISPSAAARAVPSLMKHIDSANWETRLSALFAMYSVGSREEVVELLEDAVNDPEQGVRQEAAKLLRRLVSQTQDARIQ